MLRIGLKLPYNGLPRVHKVKKLGPSKLYLTARWYETGRKLKFNDRNNKNLTVTPRLHSYQYSTGPPSGSGGPSGILLTFGAVTVGTLGILTYAKFNNEFRASLDGWIPGTDNVIKTIFMEESSVVKSISSFFGSLKEKTSDLFGSNEKPEELQFPQKVHRPIIKPIEPPPSAKPITPERPQSDYRPIKISQSKPEKKVEIVAEKPKPAEKINLSSPKDELKLPSDLQELEQTIHTVVKGAVAAYDQATAAKDNYSNNVLGMVQKVGGIAGPENWNRLKAESEKLTKSFQQAEKQAEEALKSINELAKSINDPRFDPEKRSVVKKNIDNLKNNIDVARKKFEDDVKNSKLYNEFWKQVKDAREEYHEQLRILFPDININEKNSGVPNEAFDLFVLYMYNKVNYLQQELEKMKTISENKLKAALRSAQTTGDVSTLQEEKINLEIEKEKRLIQDELDKKMLREKQALIEDFRRQLKLQAQVHADHLKEVMAVKDREIQRKVNQALNEQSEENALRNKTQLAAIIGRLKGLDEAIRARIEAEKGANEAQLLWGACQALVRAVKATPPGVSPQDYVRPLESELKAIVQAAPKNDSFVSTTIKGIPEEAAKRGVYPENALRERFTKVEQMARKLALVPEEGASIPIYILSYLQNFLLVKAVSPIPKKELENEPIDPDSFDTFDILQRSRYWLDRGDFKMTLRYMNLLKGAPKSVAKEWMNEVKILLETKQAIDALVAYAGANTLVFMGSADSGKVESTGKK